MKRRAKKDKIKRNRKGQFKDVSKFIVERKLNDMLVETFGIGEIEELKDDKVTISFDNTFRSFSLKVLLDKNIN